MNIRFPHKRWDDKPKPDRNPFTGGRIVIVMWLGFICGFLAGWGIFG